MNELATKKPTELQVVTTSPEQAAQSFIQTAMSNGTSVGDMEKLLTIWKDLVSDGKKTAFDKAMTAFQANCPPMPRGHASHLKRVNAAGVQVASRYSDMADIAKTIAPALRDAGLSYEWEETELIEVGGQPYYRAHLRIRHEAGYSERKSGPPIPIGKANNNQSAQMQAAAVVTTAQRLCLRSAFGLYSIDQDEEDAAIEAAETETITEQQSDELIALLAEYNAIKGDKVTAGLEKAMLAAVGVVSIQAIPAAKFDEVARKLVGHVATAKGVAR